MRELEGELRLEQRALWGRLAQRREQLREEERDLLHGKLLEDVRSALEGTGQEGVTHPALLHALRSGLSASRRMWKLSLEDRLSLGPLVRSSGMGCEGRASRRGFVLHYFLSPREEPVVKPGPCGKCGGPLREGSCIYGCAQT